MDNLIGKYLRVKRAARGQTTDIAFFVKREHRYSTAGFPKYIADKYYFDCAKIVDSHAYLIEVRGGEIWYRESTLQVMTESEVFELLLGRMRI